ncbi:hypothetical protein H2248_000047 [Termitomyces sp. 'cryptogamus']|nr:hypothetical protein H2248_000047 [Termitomyces sp. 'cryptogamus']
MIAMLITFLVLPPTLPVYWALYFSLSKLYFACLLAALNSREDLWEKCFGSMSGVVTTGNIVSGSDHGRHVTQQPVIMVNIERKVTVDDSPSETVKDNGARIPSYHVSSSGPVVV